MPFEIPGLVFGHLWITYVEKRLPQDLACTNSALRTESHTLLSVGSEEDGASGGLRWVVQEVG